MRRIKTLALLVVIALVGAGVWRVFVHRSDDLKPAVVTPKMNVRNEFSNDVAARLYRITHAQIARNRVGYPKLIALTFDDGPYPIFTPLLLDMLHKLRVPGTFFLIGRDAQQWPEITQRIEADGNEIGDHTFSHPDLDKESASQVREEMLHGRDVLYALTHDPGARTLMRPRTVATRWLRCTLPNRWGITLSFGPTTPAIGALSRRKRSKAIC